MTLRVVGAGLPRTGTESLALALSLFALSSATAATLVYGAGGDPVSLESGNINDTNSAIAQNQIYDTLTKVNGRYHTNAWVRPSSPNTTVTIGLREYRGGQPVPGSNTLGWTVERTGWRQFGAIHVANQSGSRLALEIMARDLPPGGYLDVDEVVLHRLRSRS